MEKRQLDYGLKSKSIFVEHFELARGVAGVQRNRYIDLPFFSPTLQVAANAMHPGRPLPATAAGLIAVVAAVATWWPAAAQLDLVLLHANDAHSHFDQSDAYGNECGEEDAARGRCYGGFARMAQFVADEKRAAGDRDVPALFLLAGDAFQGTPYYSLFKWRPVAEFVGRLRPDVTVSTPPTSQKPVDSRVTCRYPLTTGTSRNVE